MNDQTEIKSGITKLNVGGKVFHLSAFLIQKIDFLDKLVKNGEKFNNTFVDGVLYIQQDAKLFNELINFLSLPNYKIKKDLYMNVRSLANYFCMKLTHTKSDHWEIMGKTNQNKKYNSIYLINTFSFSYKIKYFKHGNFKKKILLLLFFFPFLF